MCVHIRRQQRRDLLRNKFVQPRRDVRLDDAESITAERVDLRVAEETALVGHRTRWCHASLMALSPWETLAGSNLKTRRARQPRTVARSTPSLMQLQQRLRPRPQLHLVA